MPCSMGDMETERAVSFNVMVSPALPAAMQSDPVATWHLRNIRGEKYSSTYTHSSSITAPIPTNSQLSYDVTQYSSQVFTI